MLFLVDVINYKHSNLLLSNFNSFTFQCKACYNGFAQFRAQFLFIVVHIYILKDK